MNISSNMSTINYYQNNLNQSANNLANMQSNQSNTDVAKEMTNQIIDEQGVELQTKPIQAYDSMMGTLLDIKV